ncbi:MAG: hypothetical protein AB7O66_11055 [Limisphaerales bacterium]
MTHPRRILYTLLTLVAAATAPALHGAAVVLPNSAASAEGNSGLNTALQTGPRTLQLQVAASQLTDIPVGNYLNSLTFRQNGGGSAAPSSSYSYTQYKITLGAAANSIDEMSLTFADNMLSPVTVYDGPLTAVESSYPGGATPNAWGPAIIFEVPYQYQGGDLVLLLSHPASSSGTGVLLDAVGEASTEFRSIRNSTTFDAETANISDNVFTIVRLTHSAAVPEPEEMVIVAGAGLLAMAGWRRFRRA